MDTIKSDKIVQDYLQKEPKFKRNVHKFSGTFDATPEQIFPLLCPVREADWIPGWDAELIFTESGYAEDKCVFRTNESSLSGKGVWVFTGYKPNEYIELVKFEQETIMHAKVDVVKNKDETTTLNWNITSTALSEKGNNILKSTKDHQIPDLLVKMMKHYFKKGKKISKMSLMMKMAHN